MSEFNGVESGRGRPRALFTSADRYLFHEARIENINELRLKDRPTALCQLLALSDREFAEEFDLCTRVACKQVRNASPEVVEHARATIGVLLEGWATVFAYLHGARRSRVAIATEASRRLWLRLVCGSPAPLCCDTFLALKLEVEAEVKRVVARLIARRIARLQSRLDMIQSAA